MEPSKFEICAVAGHAWVRQADEWGHWSQCKRCGKLGSPLADERVALPPGTRPSKKLTWWGMTPIERYAACGLWVYQDEVGIGSPRCVLPLGHEGFCSEVPVR